MTPGRFLNTDNVNKPWYYGAGTDFTSVQVKLQVTAKTGKWAPQFVTGWPVKLEKLGTVDLIKLGLW